MHPHLEHTPSLLCSHDLQIAILWFLTSSDAILLSNMTTPIMERDERIELSTEDWKSAVLPLN